MFAFVGAWLTAAMVSAIDPQWATPLNTLLLLLTLVAGYYINKRVSNVQHKQEQIHESVNDAAAASASAAEAAAHSARIARELGGVLRHVEAPIIEAPTVPTNPTNQPKS